MKGTHRLVDFRRKVRIESKARRDVVKSELAQKLEILQVDVIREYQDVIENDVRTQHSSGTVGREIVCQKLKK